MSEEEERTEYQRMLQVTDILMMALVMVMVMIMEKTRLIVFKRKKKMIMIMMMHMMVLMMLFRSLLQSLSQRSAKTRRWSRSSLRFHQFTN